MLDPGQRVVFLTGAPLPSSLGWTEEELCAPLQPGFIERTPVECTGNLLADDKAPSWRFLPLNKPHLPTGLTPINRDDPPFGDYGHINVETLFLSPSELSVLSSNPNEHPSERSQVSDSDKEDAFSQYYEHSFAVHETIPSSQIVGAESFDESFTTEPEDFSTAFPGSSECHPKEQLTRSRLISSHLSDLKDMPNAAHLRSITPQTMTVNLLVGIISISPPRTIKTRRGGRPIELVEMLVGDETKAGFGVNIWLPPSQKTVRSALQSSDLRTQTSQLRPQDVVLAKNVALSSFRDKVYGQSLRGGITTLDLLYRNVVDGNDARGAFCAAELEQGAIDEPQVGKVRRVRDWVMRFVGANTGALPACRGARSRPADEKQLQALPNDTPQE